MMQQVASAKSEVAAFATLQGTAEQPESNVAFEHVLKQQQTPMPAAKRRASNAVAVKSEESQRVKESATALAERQQGSNPAKEPSKMADNVTTNGKETQSQAEQKKQNVDGTKASSETQAKSLADADKTTKSNEAELDGDDNSDEQSLEKRTEQWLDLVWSLQEESEVDEQIQPADIDSLEALKVWLEPIEDKLQALSNLIEQRPEVKSWLATGDANEDAATHSLISQVLAADKASDPPAETAVEKQNASLDLTQKTVVTDGVTAISDKLKQELMQVSQDIITLIKNDSLNADELQLVNQALAESLNQNKPVEQSIKDLLQEKLSASSLVESNLSKNGKAKSNEMPIIFVPQTDEAGNILDANSGKIAVPENLISKDLQALLDKITGLDKTSAQSNTDKQAVSENDLLINKLAELDNSETQVTKEIAVSLIESSAKSVNPLANDKVSLSKEAALVNNQAALKAESAVAAVTTNDELKALLTLSDDELDVALNSVAQRVAALLRDDAKSQVGLPSKGVNALTVPATTNGKDILAALKAGVAEFKDQLAAGHEPGLDLKALVSQALEKTGDGAVVAKVAEGLDKSIRTLSQSLAALNQINESSINQAMNAAAIDSQVTQAEQHKATQLNQFDNKLDKALNLHKPEGHQQLADKVRWMVNTGNLIAEIRLDPAELGSVHVKVSLSAESATVNFVVQSQQTRDALEAATPKLREMLAEKGIELGQSTVKQDNHAKQDSQGQAGQQAKNGTNLNTGDVLSEDESRLVNHNSTKINSPGVIDYFV